MDVAVTGAASVRQCIHLVCRGVSAGIVNSVCLLSLRIQKEQPTWARKTELQMPEIHCQECNAWATHVQLLEGLLSTKNAICNERIADMLAQDAAASGHQFTDAAATFKTVVEQQKKELEGLRNDRDNLGEELDTVKRRLAEMETRFAIYGGK
jgi:hypothetical protein